MKPTRISKIAKSKLTSKFGFSKETVPLLSYASSLFIQSLTRASYIKTAWASRAVLSADDIKAAQKERLYLLLQHDPKPKAPLAPHLQRAALPVPGPVPQLSSLECVFSVAAWKRLVKRTQRSANGPAAAVVHTAPEVAPLLARLAELYILHLAAQIAEKHPSKFGPHELVKRVLLKQPHIEATPLIQALRSHRVVSTNDIPSSSSSLSNLTSSSSISSSSSTSSSSSSSLPIISITSSSSTSSPTSSSSTPTSTSSSSAHPTSRLLNLPLRRPPAIVSLSPNAASSRKFKGPPSSLLVPPSAPPDLAGFFPLGPPELFEEPCPMTPSQAASIERENTWRQLFAQDPANPELSDPYLGLTPVFAHPEAFRYREEDALERAQPKILSFWRPDLAALAGQPSVASRELFEARWREFTHGAFEGMRWDGVFAAGGALLACLTAQEHVKASFDSSDIDLFLYGFPTDEEANEKVRHIYSVVKANSGGKRDCLVRTKRTITILADFPLRHIQIILRLYRSPGEVLLGFDLDSCGVGFDGSGVWCTHRFTEAINKAYNLLNHTRFSLTTEIRLEKYAKRGFALVIPDLDKRRVDPGLWKRSFKKTRGLSRLLLYEYLARKDRFLKEKQQQEKLQQQQEQEQEQQENQPPLGTIDGPDPNPYNQKRSEFEHAARAQPSDYDDVHIPWGPNWVVENILKMLNIKDRRKFFGGSHRRVADTKSRAKSYRKHTHLFVTGIDGAIDGTSSWCRLCHKTKSGAATATVGPSRQGATYAAGQPIEWLRDCPSYQDYERGFRRKLMTGSFFPVLSADFCKGVYLEDVQDDSTSLFKSHPVAESLFDCPPPLHSITSRTASIAEKLTSLNFTCQHCQQSFLSRNQLYHHLKTVTHDPQHFQAGLDAIPLPRPSASVSSKDNASFRFRKPPKRANASQGIGLGIGKWKISRFAEAAQRLAHSVRRAPVNATPTSATSTSPAERSITTTRPQPSFQYGVPDPAKTIRWKRFSKKLAYTEPYIAKVCSTLPPIPRALVVLSTLIGRQMLTDPIAIQELKRLICLENDVMMCAIDIYFIDFDSTELLDTLAHFIQ